MLAAYGRSILQFSSVKKYERNFILNQRDWIKTSRIKSTFIRK